MRILLFLPLFFAFAAQAQPSAKELEKHREKVQKSLEKGKNIRSLDTLFATGKPYCIMKGLAKGLGGPVEYTIRPLKRAETEEIYMVMSAEGTGASAVWYWDMVFVNLGQKIRFRNGTLDPENTMVDYNLFNNSAINVAGVNKLVLLKGNATPAPVPAPGSSGPDMVHRNRNGMIQIFGEKIEQSGVHIGNISKEVKAGNGGVITYYNITLPTGKIVATARNHGATDHEWELTTARDSNLHTLSSSLGHDEKDLVKFLVERLYL